MLRFARGSNSLARASRGQLSFVLLRDGLDDLSTGRENAVYVAGRDVRQLRDGRTRDDAAVAAVDELAVDRAGCASADVVPTEAIIRERASGIDGGESRRGEEDDGNRENCGGAKKLLQRGHFPLLSPLSRIVGTNSSFWLRIYAFPQPEPKHILP